MKQLLTIFFIHFVCSIVYSQSFDPRVFTSEFFNKEIDTCECTELKIMEQKTSLFGKTPKITSESTKKYSSHGKLIEDGIFSYRYDSLGRVSKIFIGIYNHKMAKLSYYDSAMVLEAYERIDSSREYIKQRVEKYYFNNDNKIKVKVIQGTQYVNKSYTFYDYNESGNITTQYVGNSNDKDSTKGRSIVMNWNYDSQGRLVEITEFRPYPYPVWITHFEYNKQGLRMSKTLYNQSKDRNPSKKEDRQFFSRKNYEYYENGLIKSERYCHRKNKCGNIFLIEYNNKGKKTTITKTTTRGRTKRIMVYEYKGLGRN